jgi:hypothetical protein
LFCLFAVFALVTLLAVVSVTTAMKSFVHVIDQDSVSTVGTRFAFTPPIPELTIASVISKCHSIVVRDGSSESDSSASERFGFGESYFRAHGWRLCTPFELFTISVVTKLPDGRYITDASPGGFDFLEFEVEEGRLDNEDEADFVNPEAYTAANQIAVCCSGAQFDHVGQGASK